MGTISSKAPNPNISDKSDSRYTPLNEFNRKIGTRALIADLGATMGNQIHEHLYVEENMPLGDVLINVSVGDIAIMGNRHGVVVAVLTGLNTDSKTDVVAIKVFEDMRYLPLPWSDDATGFGYDSNVTKQGRTVTYILGNHKNDVNISAFVVDGKQCQPGSHSFYSGQIDIIKKHTADPKSWTYTARMLKKYSDKYDKAVKSSFTSQGFVFTDVDEGEAKLFIIEKLLADNPGGMFSVPDVESFINALDPEDDAELIDDLATEFGAVEAPEEEE